MATAVTLKESDGSEIYPVTDISLVNNGIHAVDIEATTPVPAVETAMIADGAVTSGKIDWTTVWQAPLVETALWSASVSFDLKVGCHALVMMMSEWVGIVLHHGGGWDVKTLYNGGIAPSHSENNNTITFTSYGAQTWTVFKSN